MKKDFQWRRLSGYRNEYELFLDGGTVRLAYVAKMEYCTFWYVWLADESGQIDEPQGRRFRVAWEAKAHALLVVSKAMADKTEESVNAYRFAMPVNGRRYHIFKGHGPFRRSLCNAWALHVHEDELRVEKVACGKPLETRGVDCAACTRAYNAAVYPQIEKRSHRP